MSSKNDDVGKQQWEVIVREYALKAYDAQERLDEEGTEGYTSTEIQKQLASAAVSYHRVLKEYREEGVVEDGEFPDIAFLKNRLGKTIQRTAPAPGWSRASTVEEVPAVTEIPARKISDTIDELHDFRKQLGMKGTVNKSTPRTNIDQDLVKEVEEWRQRKLE